MPAAPLYLRTLWRYTNAVIIIIIILLLLTQTSTYVFSFGDESELLFRQNLG